MEQTTSAPRRAARRHRGRTVLIVLLALVVLLAAGGYGLYRHWNRNITSVDLPTDIGASSGATQLQGLPSGVAQNIVVVGTDARANAEDCKLGGACDSSNLSGSETNADVEMIVHISADHSSMSIVSIPRDTVVDMPACSGNGQSAGERTARINSSLNYGIDCTLRTLHKVTGLAITHFMMVDFSGVVSLSDAVGGVDVCVDKNVYDPYSHLKLAQGNHTLQGVAALQFLRTRHGFGDGSDLGRTVAQHLFLSSLQRKLESAGTLLNPTKVYNLAEAGTKALTVDSGLASVATLAQVATTVGGIPASNTAYVTMPTTVNPQDQNTVVPAAAATKLFQRLAADQPLAGASTSASASASGSSPASADSSSTATGQAGGTSTASDTSGQSSGSATSSATASGDPATDGVAQVASDNTGCATVSTQDTVAINGQAMTPTEAYAATPGIKDSDKS